jgi:hypothetical protein
MSVLSAFGLFALIVMLICSAFEQRSAWLAAVGQLAVCATMTLAVAQVGKIDRTTGLLEKMTPLQQAHKLYDDFSSGIRLLDGRPGVDPVSLFTWVDRGDASGAQRPLSPTLALEACTEDAAFKPPFWEAFQIPLRTASICLRTTTLSSMKYFECQRSRESVKSRELS